MTTTAQARRASGTDTIGHSSVQPWSAGPIFPAVISLVYRNGSPYYAELILDGITQKVPNYKAAVSLAYYYLKNPMWRKKRYFYSLAKAAGWSGSLAFKPHERAVDAYGVI